MEDYWFTSSVCSELLFYMYWDYSTVHQSDMYDFCLCAVYLKLFYIFANFPQQIIKQNYVFVGIWINIKFLNISLQETAF